MAVPNDYCHLRNRSLGEAMCPDTNGSLKVYWLSGDGHLVVVVTVLFVNVSRIVGSTCVHISTWSPDRPIP